MADQFLILIISSTAHFLTVCAHHDIRYLKHVLIQYHCLIYRNIIVVSHKYTRAQMTICLLFTYSKIFQYNLDVQIFISQEIHDNNVHNM